MRLTIFLTVAMAAWGQKPSPFKAIPSTPEDVLRFEKPVGSFEAKDLRGKTWTAKSFEGRVTVVHIWYTPCLFCMPELDNLQRFYRESALKNTVQVLTISLDRDPEKVRAFLKQKGYTFPVLVDSGLHERIFDCGPGQGSLPETFVIDRVGRQSNWFKTWTLGRVLIEAEKFEAQQ